MENKVINNVVDNSFHIGLISKGLNGIAEIVSGSLLLFIKYDKISHFIKIITQQELLEDPKDFIANKLLNFSSSLSINSQLFFSFYLLSHGIIKLLLVYFLLKNKLWAYPVAIIIFILFIAYQIYRYTNTHSLGLIILTVIDIIIIILTILKYIKLNKK